MFQISLSNFWLDRIFQTSCQKLFVTSFRQIPLYFILHFPLGNLTFVTIYCCAVVQTLSYLHEHKFLWFGKKCVSSSDKLMLLWIILLLHAVHRQNGYMYLFNAQCTHQITVRSVACNKLEVSERQFWWRIN
jgi:hypothetical protein